MRMSTESDFGVPASGCMYGAAEWEPDAKFDKNAEKEDV